MWDKRNDMVVHEADPFNAEPTRAALADHRLTPVDTFYSRNHGPVPDFDAAEWRLTVDGLVGAPLELGLDDLLDWFEQHTLDATLQCAGNRRSALIPVRDIPGEARWGPGATSTASWTGVRLADVLRFAGVGDSARHVQLLAPDVSDQADPPQAYGSSIPITKAMSEEVLLVWRMNDEELPRLHGGPVRVIVPGYIGARSVKWVERITLAREPSSNFFQETAYRLLPVDGEPGPGVGIPLASVGLNSDVLVPSDGETVPSGQTDVSGYAYAGDDRGVARVDVSVDEGRTWVQADLHSEAGTWTWQLWRTRVELPEGETRIVVRAWDTTAATQPESAEQVWNPKGYVNNSWGHATVSAVRQRTR